MTVIAFTGPTQLMRNQELFVARRLDAMTSESFDTWRSGCAHGVDTMAARQAIMMDVLVVELYVPAAPHNADLVEELADRAKIIPCPLGADRAESYRKRNELLVHNADLLVAFVRQPNFYRSGEWMTINIARKFGVEVQVNVV